MGANGPMKISAKAEYACLALLALAQQGPDAPPLRIRQISETHGIPERYLVQILLQLKGAGLVISTRGASGGYRLACPAAEITLSQVLAVIDGPDTSPRDSSRETRPAARILAAVWERVRAAERSVLDTTTIAELVAQASPHEWTI
jgi:Rrf2 family transcriptional regulator, cysteine metabolism repressor